MCTHEPRCPSAGDAAREAAHVIACHPEQGWSLLCNGVVLFDDGGLLLPAGCGEEKGQLRLSSTLEARSGV